MESYDEEALRHIKSDVATWFLMSSIYPILGITMVYLIFVTVVGPKMIRNRKPMNLTTTMMAYNAAHVAFSLWWLSKMTTNWKAIRYIGNSVFQPKLFIIDEKLENQIDELGYYYLMTKYVELLDTVFFVLRKKWSQVTFLHVYHHTNMAIATWVYLKYIWGRHTAIMCFVNSFVHAIMYSYYLLAALGPAVRPYLWWKKYITKLQLGQFVILLIYLLIMMYNKCPVQPSFMYFSIFNTSVFMLLFVNFYRKAYVTRIRESSRTSHQDNAETQVKDNSHRVNAESKENGHITTDHKQTSRLLKNDHLMFSESFTDIIKNSAITNYHTNGAHAKSS